jgi:tetratricopeptide (TPR) repeat protein
MRRLSMMSIRKFQLTWPTILVLVVSGLVPIEISAQTPKGGQAPTDANFEQLRLAADSEVQNGENAKAIRDIQSALQIKPDWKEGWWTLGTLQYEANQYADAVQAFQKVVTYAPQLGTAWAVLGLCEFELKQYAASLSHLERAQTLGLGDDVETAHVTNYHLALLLIREGQFERGAELLHLTFGSGPPSSQVQLALGLALLRVPLLPDEIDPSHDALLRAAGNLASSTSNSLQRFPEFLESHPATPFVHYAYGLRLRKAGHWNEALAQQRAEAKISPRSPLPWNEISALQMKLNHQAEAASAAQRAKTLEPDIYSPHSEKSLRDPRIISLYESSSRSIGNASEQTVGVQERTLAMQDYSTGHYSDTISRLKPWLNANPADGTSWAVLGLSEFGLKDYDNAQIHLERSEQLGLNGSADAIRKAKYTLGILLVRSGNFDHASKVLSSAAGAGTLQSEVRFASGLAILRIGKLPEAVAPEQREPVDRAGEIAQLLFASRYDEADPKFEVLLKQYRQLPFLHYAYGTALLAISRYKDAQAQMQAETAISPGSELPYVRLASIALRQQQPSDAIEPAEHAIKLAAGSAEAHYLLGRAALALGDTTRSVRELQIACSLAPSSPEVHFNLAKAYGKAGQTHQAEEERARFTELNAVADARRQEGNQTYQGPHDTGEMSVSPQPVGSAAPPN